MAAGALHSAGKFVGIEMIRDGGSLAALFEGGADGYLLLLKHRSVRDESTWTIVAYENPVLIDTDPVKRAAGASELAGPSAAISWEEAQALLADARPATDAADYQVKCLDMMKFIVANRGAVPESLRAPRPVLRL